MPQDIEIIFPPKKGSDGVTRDTAINLVTTKARKQAMLTLSGQLTEKYGRKVSIEAMLWSAAILALPQLKELEEANTKK